MTTTEQPAGFGLNQENTEITRDGEFLALRDPETNVITFQTQADLKRWRSSVARFLNAADVEYSNMTAPEDPTPEPEPEPPVEAQPAVAVEPEPEAAPEFEIKEGVNIALQLREAFPDKCVDMPKQNPRSGDKTEGFVVWMAKTFPKIYREHYKVTGRGKRDIIDSAGHKIGEEQCDIGRRKTALSEVGAVTKSGLDDSIFSFDAE